MPPGKLCLTLTLPLSWGKGVFCLQAWCSLLPLQEADVTPPDAEGQPWLGFWVGASRSSNCSQPVWLRLLWGPSGPCLGPLWVSVQERLFVMQFVSSSGCGLLGLLDTVTCGALSLPQVDLVLFLWVVCTGCDCRLYKGFWFVFFFPCPALHPELYLPDLLC